MKVFEVWQGKQYFLIDWQDGKSREVSATLAEDSATCPRCHTRISKEKVGFCIKETVSRDFLLQVFCESVSLKVLSIPRCTTGINDIGGAP
jgi:hypothetical protein